MPDAIFTAFMRKRPTPKKQLCRKHGTTKVRSEPPVGVLTRNAAAVRQCPDCEREEQEGK